MTDLSDRLQIALGDAFRLERELARGGMSQLFLATEASLNRQVVIKLLPPEFASEVSAARFKQEIELAAHLQHPNILPVLTAGAKDDLIYYVMPYVPGESLRHRLTSEGKLPVADALRVLHEVADALAYAHAHGVVHRDIKPENILLEHGHAVLTDFGVARAVAEARSGGRLTETGMAVGTPGYMSPEQAAGDTHIDARADVYALAVVGYEMLNGAPPFTGPSAQAIMAAHLTEMPKPLREVRGDTPPGVSAAIEKALAKDPAERLQTAAELRDALGIAVGAPPEAARPLRRYAVLGAVAAVVLAAVIALWPRGWSVEGDPRKSLIVFPFENRTGDADNEWLQEASMNLIGLSLAHWEDLRVFDDERTASLMRRREVESPADLDFDAAQRMAREANVGTLVIGDIRRERDSLAIEAKVHDVASGERLATEIVRAELRSDPRELFDSLAARILQVSGAPAGERPGVVAQTTRSLDAYREYLAGTDALQRFDLATAQARLERAVELDSTFALAYIQLRNVEGWSPTGGDVEKRRALIAKAATYSEELPSRLKMLVDFHSAYENDQLARARSIVEQLIARDSTDVEAWYQLGEAHFHHSSQAFPHPDSLGNLGKALQAFQRALALDSSYTLAYFHILGALTDCARATAPYVCLGDSVVYGEPAQLRDQFGPSELEQLRGQAEDEQVATAYAWVSAAPNAVRAREGLVQVLIQRERYDEAANQVTYLKDLGLASRALAYEAHTLFAKRQFTDAADRMQKAIAAVSDSELGNFDAYGDAVDILTSAGRVREGIAVSKRQLALFPVDSFPVAGRRRGEAVWIPVRIFGSFEDVLAAEFRVDTATVGQAVYALLDTLRNIFARDTAAYRVLLTAEGWGLTTAYLWSRDTTILAHFVDMLDSDIWPSAHAHLVLARGDTARARALVERNFRPEDADPRNWNVEEREEAYAWADLLARLGNLREAINAYALLDSLRPGGGSALLIRSWAERGALYQQLGEDQKAIEMYQKFVATLEDGDEMVQPMVDRARQALAALRGETTEPRR